MHRKKHYCSCGWSGRVDKIKRHKEICTAYKIIDVMKERIDNLEVQKDPSSNKAMDLMIKKYMQLQEEKKKLEKELQDHVQEKRNNREGINYIIQTRESIRMQEDVYKIGMTNDIERRLAQYPKGSQVVKTINVSDRIKCEKVLLYLFNLKYIKRTDMGNEYFEGDLQSMIDTFDEIAYIFA